MSTACAHGHAVCIQWIKQRWSCWHKNNL
jgi:hypothetical protein